jgi:hypothetical protein
MLDREAWYLNALELAYWYGPMYTPGDIALELASGRRPRYSPQTYWREKPEIMVSRQNRLIKQLVCAIEWKELRGRRS